MILENFLEFKNGGISTGYSLGYTCDVGPFNEGSGHVLWSPRADC